MSTTDVQQHSPKKAKADEQTRLTTSEKVAPKPGKFKVLAHLVKAAQRFQASLNPTYEYGKRQSTDDTNAANHVMVQPKNASKTMSGTRSASGRTISGKPSTAGQTHGHKGALLFKPLADVRS